MLETMKLCFRNHIILCCLPFHITHKLQLLEVGGFDLLKAAYREQVVRTLPTKSTLLPCIVVLVKYDLPPKTLYYPG
jgi:hypothetical protein